MKTELILVADGGSTSCDWICLKSDSYEFVEKFKSDGLNPAYTSAIELTNVVTQSKQLSDVQNSITSIYFFGAGCKSDVFASRLENVFKSFFPNLKNCIIKGDIEGAVYACTNKPAIVGILGTGSNICYFDGSQISTRLASLGYSVMDDGAGSALGRLLLRSYFYNQLPSHLSAKFSEEYNLSPDYLKSNIYHNAFPGRFMASYAKFVFENLDNEFVEGLLIQNLEQYFETHVSKYEDILKEHPLHLVGSVACLSSNQIRKLCDNHKIELGSIIQSPIDNLAGNINFYINRR